MFLVKLSTTLALMLVALYVYCRTNPIEDREKAESLATMIFFVFVALVGCLLALVLELLLL